MFNTNQPQLITASELAMIVGGTASLIVAILPDTATNDMTEPGSPPKPPK